MFDYINILNFIDLVSFMIYCVSPVNQMLLALKHCRAFALNEVLFYFMSYSFLAIILILIIIKYIIILYKVVQTKTPFLELSLGRYFYILSTVSEIFKVGYICVIRKRVI